MPSARPARATFVAATLVALAVSAAAAQENYESWEPMKDPFESTGGGGIMIGGYDPWWSATSAAPNFTATDPGGTVYPNMVEFDAVRPRAASSAPTASGGPSTAAPRAPPLRVFIRDGVSRGSP